MKNKSLRCFRQLSLIAIITAIVLGGLWNPLPAQSNQVDPTISANDRSKVTMTRLSENAPPLTTFEEWLAGRGTPGPFSVEFIKTNTPRRTIKKMAIIVNSTLGPLIEPSLDQYLIDIATEGYLGELHYSTGGTHSDLRTFIQGRYADGIEGVLLIGDLPVAWFEKTCGDEPPCPCHEEFPCDLYYMDMDGIWNDGDGDGRFDNHRGNVAPEIWLGRLTASPLTFGGATEVGLLQNYFQKNHDYRTGVFTGSNRALVFVDDPWALSAFDYLTDVRLAYTSSVPIDRFDHTTAGNYEANLDNNFEHIIVFAHSTPDHHTFESPSPWGTSYTQTSFDEVITIDPDAIFYNLFACSNARFIETNYMGGWYIFCQTRGLAAIGSTKAGAMLDFDHFYQPFGSGSTFGESFLLWFQEIASGGFTDGITGEICWHYGMTLCGDPTLLLDPTPVAEYYVLLIDRTGSMLQPFTGTNRFTLAKEAAINDAEDIFDANPDAMIAVGTFMTPDPNYPENPEINFTGFFGSVDEGAVIAAINGIDVPLLQYSTCLARAMADAADLLKETNPDGLGILYTYTDGDENISQHNDDLSSIFYGCGPFLTTDFPNVWPDWESNCDPAEPDEPATLCTEYQTCMAEQLVDNDIIYVKYFGDPYSKDRNGSNYEGDLSTTVAGSEVAVTDYEFASGRATAPDLNWLRYLANNSGGSLYFQCDYNDPPVITDCPGNAVIHWGDVYTSTISAYDPDGGPLTYMLASITPPGQFPSPPYEIAIDPNTGVITWHTMGAAVCEHTVTVVVKDECEAKDTCEFIICVTNDPPQFDMCSVDEATIYWGVTASGSASAFDPDNGPLQLHYSLVSFDGPGYVDIDVLTGSWIWETEEDMAYVGDFTLCIAVTDSALICDPCSPNNADTCCINVTVIPRPEYSIEKTHNTFQGHFDFVSITVNHSELDMGGFDFLIAYDASALTFMEATPGQLLEDCGWEYFTYNYGVHGSCGSACPSGMLRIVAMAETNDGPNHPSCFGPPDTDPHELAEMKFLVTNDRTFECQYVPIKFFWDDCGDNAISSVDGEVLYVSDHVYEFDGTDITDPTFGFPTYFGVQAECLDNPDPDKPDPVQCIDFVNGGIDIVCGDSIDASCDLNCNEQQFEIADAVTLVNYFLYGTYAFTACIEAAPTPLEGIEAAIAASDCNSDGVVLTVADLVYLIRVIVGDALPYPKPAPIDAVYSINDGILSVNLEIAAAHMIIKGKTNPTNLTGNMEMEANYIRENNETHVLLYSMEKGQTFEGDFLKFEGTLLEIEAANYDCATVKFSNDLLPTEFALHQNRPNPFNPITGISFSLPVASDVTLEIFNINGQKVATAARDHFEAGIHTVDWNGTNYASGIYLYKITAGEFVDTKKMLLLK